MQASLPATLALGSSKTWKSNVILEPKAIESIKAFITSSFSRKRESEPRYTVDCGHWAACFSVRSCQSKLCLDSHLWRSKTWECYHYTLSNHFCRLYRNIFSYTLLYTITYKPRNLSISGRIFVFLARGLLYTDCSKNFRTTNNKPKQRSKTMIPVLPILGGIAAITTIVKNLNDISNS